MKILTTSKSAADPSAILFIFTFEDEKPSLPPGVSVAPGALEDFKGRFRQTIFTYPEGKSKITRVALAGLGKKDKFTIEEMRRAAGLVWNASKEKGAKVVSVMFPESALGAVGHEAAGCAIAEGLTLASYKYTRFKSAKESESGAKATKAKSADVKNAPAGPETVQIHCGSADFRDGIERGQRNGLAANFARELEDAPANYATPTVLADAARKLAGGRVSCKIFDVKDMKKHAMGALLGVAQGSVEPPKFIILHYKPKGRVRETVAIVGKGLTFDTGGISIKPAASMDEMKYDMCGGGAVLGCFHALREMDVPVEVYGLIPSTENMPGGKAYKPGDVLRACDGTTIEVLNTDAEGRIILCDAIAYAEKNIKPDIIIDLATLTGAIVVALGHEMTGVFANDANLQKELVAAGDEAGERCWPMPLWDVHRDQVKSDIADLKNINSPKDGGGSIAGAAFLAHFVKNAKWAHMDIAGTAWGGRERDYLHASGASGVGVRTLLQFIIQRGSKK